MVFKNGDMDHFVNLILVDFLRKSPKLSKKCSKVKSRFATCDTFDFFGVTLKVLGNFQNFSTSSQPKLAEGGWDMPDSKLRPWDGSEVLF